ncbi:aminoglycoside phosphotransferase family protein [Kutzneria buriramensis]|uniref:Aminoglycoside phosphotransferase (APT) family kinase protein n=1 Tax=Kutzneria buriramensis TaxID=1045776 RepID=A0A3E0H0F0_9PSEU|nr:aminoglycoside phosphotransferase family protein [Kutzneria buriramensis]REH35295.1 aminoglycoside phosphotransferase (APT) family kinase protein [Kutzneria buriramensis]
MSSDAVVVDVPQVRRLIAAQFPQWADLPVTPVATSGVDNISFRLGEGMLIRMPRFARWTGQVTREQRWLPLLAPLLPLAVPEPLGRGRPGEGYPFPWSVYRWIEGTNADLSAIDDPGQAAIDLADFLLALRDIDTSGGPPPEWSNGFRGVALHDHRDSAVVASRLRDRIAVLDGFFDVEAVTAVWQAGLDAPAWAGPPVWVHGDLVGGNMVARAGRLAAVIDFGTLAVGDPACDLIAAWGFLPAGARAEFRKLLAVDDATWARGRVWGLTSLLPSMADLADPVRAARARQGLTEIVADLRD